MDKAKPEHSPLGSRFESFLVEAGIHEETVEYVAKATFAWQLDEVRKAKGLSKKQFAELIGTSRSQLDRVLDPDNEGVTIETLKKAAHILGKKIRLALVDEAAA